MHPIKFLTGLIIFFILSIVKLSIYNSHEANANYNYTQNLANEEIQQVEKDGYLKEDEKAIIGNKLNDEGLFYEIKGTSTKASKGSRVFINIQLYSKNLLGAKDCYKNILVTGTAN